MHLDGRTRPRLGTATNRLSRWLAVLFPFSIVGGVLGQGYLVPPQGFQGAPAVPTMGNMTPSTGQANGQMSSKTIERINEQANGEPAGNAKTQGNGQLNGEASTQTEGGPSGTSSAPLAAPVDSLMRWGAVHAHLHANYQFLYDTGIHTSPGVSTETFTHTITAGVSLNIGPHVSADYTPAIRFYSQKGFHNTVDHSMSLNAGVHYGDWTIGTSHSFTISDEPLVETSSQTEQKSYSGGLFASYNVSEKVSLATTAGVGINFVGSSTNVFVGGPTNAPSQLSDSVSYSASEWLNYEFNEKVSGGVGVTLGYSEQRGGFKSIDQQYNGRLGWHPGTKLSVSLTGGLEHQNFLDSKTKTTDAWNPIYSAAVGYQLFEQTSLSLSANRSVSASLFQNQISESTGVGVGLQQRLLGKLNLSLGMAYSKSDYKSTTANLTTTRSDEGTSYNVGLSMPFLTRCNVSTFYLYSQSSSSQGGFGYSSSQVGATLSWAY